MRYGLTKITKSFLIAFVKVNYVNYNNMANFLCAFFCIPLSIHNVFYRKANVQKRRKGTTYSNFSLVNLKAVTLQSSNNRNIIRYYKYCAENLKERNQLSYMGG
jgi:hypothetical protein